MKFMVNIAEKYLSRDQPLSPGQNELYEKIVHKYRKQLRKRKLNYKEVIALPWKNDIVSIEVLNRKTYFRLTDNNMELYFNFNKKQIEEVRSIVHDDVGNHLNIGRPTNFGNGQKYDFNWNNASKTWSGPYNTYLFAQLYKFAVSANVKIESSVTDLVDEMSRWGTKEHWTPSMHIVNDRVYINMIAETMLDKLADIDMADTSVRNIEEIAKLGIAPPDEYASIVEYLSSAASVTHLISTVDDVAVLKDYIDTCNRKTLFHIGELDSSGFQKAMPDVIDALRDCDTWGTESSRTEPVSYSDSFIKPLSDENEPKEFDKLSNIGYNTLVTTTPITSLISSQSKIGMFALNADKVIYIHLKEPK